MSPSSHHRTGRLLLYAGVMLGATLTSPAGTWAQSTAPASEAASEAPARPAPPATGNAQPPTTAAADLAADLAFWTSVKDSRDAAELLAYLKAFPDGQFAVLARLRLDALRGDDAMRSETVIKEVQNRLYDLNYVVTSISGQLDPVTTAAIRRWQELNGLQQTGKLDAAQLERLRAQQPPGTWAALAFSGGVREAALGATSRKEAEARALAACFQKSAGRECKVLAAAGTQCIAAAAFRTPDGGLSTVAILRRTLAEAQVAAITSCSEDPKSGGSCEIVSKVCANMAGGAAPTAPPPPAKAPPRKREQET